MKCSECGSPMTDKQRIKQLEKKVAELERKLALEKRTDYIPYVPYNPPHRYPRWNEYWWSDHTGGTGGAIGVPEEWSTNELV